jgi:uncharacterized protein YjbJ (UPF0337 family)
MMYLTMQAGSTGWRQLPKGAASSETRHGAAPPHEATARAAASDEGRGTAMMGGEIEQIKRRIKKAAGVLADDDSLSSEGKLDQVVGKVKIKVERVKGKLQQAVDQMKAAVAAKRASRWTK